MLLSVASVNSQRSTGPGSVAKESSFRNVPTGRYVSGRLVRLYDFSSCNNIPLKRTSPSVTYLPVGMFQNDLSFATDPSTRLKCEN